MWFESPYLINNQFILFYTVRRAPSPIKKGKEACSNRGRWSRKAEARHLRTDYETLRWHGAEEATAGPASDGGEEETAGGRDRRGRDPENTERVAEKFWSEFYIIHALYICTNFCIKTVISVLTVTFHKINGWYDFTCECIFSLYKKVYLLRDTENKVLIYSWNATPLIAIISSSAERHRCISQESRESRVNSWKDFQKGKSSKKFKGMKPPKHRAESR